MRSDSVTTVGGDRSTTFFEESNDGKQAACPDRASWSDTHCDVQPTGVRNACDGALARAINDAMDLLDNEQDLFIGIITGAGLKAFVEKRKPLERTMRFQRGCISLRQWPQASPEFGSE